MDIDRDRRGARVGRLMGMVGGIVAAAGPVSQFPTCGQ